MESLWDVPVLPDVERALDAGGVDLGRLYDRALFGFPFAGHDLPFVVLVPPYLHELEALVKRYQGIYFSLIVFEWSTCRRGSKWIVR